MPIMTGKFKSTYRRGESTLSSLPSISVGNTIVSVFAPHRNLVVPTLTNILVAPSPQSLNFLETL